MENTEKSPNEQLKLGASLRRCKMKRDRSPAIICSKLTIETLEKGATRCSSFSIVNFE